MSWVRTAAHNRFTLWCMLGVAIFSASAIRAKMALTDFDRARVAARDTLGQPQRCAARVRVMQSPVVRTSSRTPSEPDGPDRVTQWLGRTRLLDCELSKLAGPWDLRLSGGPEELARGDEVEVVANLAPVQIFRNAGLPDPLPGAARRQAVLSGAAMAADVVVRGQSLSSWIDRERWRVRSRIEATYPTVVAPLGRALVLGENDLNDEDAAAFSRSGLLHLLAVSGTHLVIAVLALVQAMRALLVRLGPLSRRYDTGRIACGLGAGLSLLYADFAGGSGSAWRAAYMLCVVLLGRALGTRVPGPAALGASLLVGIAFDPLAASDLSFLLSALATAGLIGLGQPLGCWIARGPFERGVLQKVAASLAATVSSTLPCSPALALLDGQMTAAALAANLVAGPLGELLALPACLLHVVVGAWPPLEKGLALVGAGALFGVRAVAMWSASVGWAQFSVPLPTSYQIATGALAVLSGTVYWMVRPQLAPANSARGAQLSPISRGVWLGLFVALATWTVTLFARQLAYAKRPLLAVTALDVGQGDAVAVDFPGGQFALIDGGGFVGGIPDPGSRVLVPLARARGRSNVDLMVLSHAHPDHLLGLLSAAKDLQVAEFWHPEGAAPPLGPYKELLDTLSAQGTQIFGPEQLCHRPRELGQVRIQVLAPCPRPAGLGLNDESLVLQLTYGQRSVLLTGDIEQAGEARLVAREGSRLRSDFLKIAHHGSHTSTSEALLAATNPTYASISSGVRNRFDHPRQVTLDRLVRSHVQFLRTDRSGSISYLTDGGWEELRAFSEPR